MYSMEINSAEKKEKDLNLISLFNCIKMLFGNASDILNSSSIPWKQEKILFG